VRDANGNITSFTYDYFIKDHLGNVRMVLTEEQKQDQYPAATLEGSTASGALSMINYEKQFYTIDNTKIIAKTNVPGFTTSNDYQNNNGNPPPNSSYPSNYTVNSTSVSENMYKLNATTNKTGLGIVLKVMAGDKIDIHGKSYYQSSQTYNNSNSTQIVLADIIGAFIGSPDNAGIMAKGATSAGMETANTGLIPSTFFRGSNGESTTVPKAYINYIFFDEQFKYAGGNFSRVGTSGTVKSHWFSDTQLQNIVVPKNGYIYVYVSNESNADVFFDNLQVFHTKGPILEETHYYPFGLTMAGISSKAAGGVKNKRKYNDGTELANKEFSDGSGLEWYETTFRSYDPQIGRFHQIDELSDDYESWSPYTFALDNPILLNDPLGLSSEVVIEEPRPETSTEAKPTILEEVVVTGFRITPKPTDPVKNPIIPQGMGPRPNVFEEGSGVKPAGIKDNNNGLSILLGTVSVLPRLSPGGLIVLGIGVAYIVWESPIGQLMPTYRPGIDNTYYNPPNIVVRPILRNNGTLPPYPSDPTTPPGQGWIWQGRPGSTPGSKQGNWWNPGTKESLRPDLNNPDHDPHWDYKDPNGQWHRWYPDGRIEPK
jgi:RHS repeat-associated protein